MASWSIAVLECVSPYDGCTAFGDPALDLADNARDNHCSIACNQVADTCGGAINDGGPRAA